MESAQPIYESPPSLPQSGSLHKKIILIGILGSLLLILVLFSLLLTASKSTKKADGSVPVPTGRPTATPIVIPSVTPLITATTVPASTQSAAITPVKITPTPTKTKIGRLAFIKNGDIYHSDGTTYDLLFANSSPAGDKLSWSPDGKMLAWRPKTTSGTPSLLTILNREEKLVHSIKPSSSESPELIDYDWTKDSSNIVILSKDDKYNITFYPSLVSSAAGSTIIYSGNNPIEQIARTDKDTVLFIDSSGIKSVSPQNPDPKTLINEPKVITMKISPKRDKLLYSVGDNQKSDLYIMNADGTNIKKLDLPSNINMGSTGLTKDIINKGFVPNALWFPNEDKLMVGFRYLSAIPLVGIYNITDESFEAVNPFIMFNSDQMIDDLRLFGIRVNTSGASPIWQLNFFTLEDNVKLGIIRVIPQVSSFAFYNSTGSDLTW